MTQQQRPEMRSSGNAGASIIAEVAVDHRQACESLTPCQKVVFLFHLPPLDSLGSLGMFHTLQTVTSVITSDLIRPKGHWLSESGSVMPSGARPFRIVWCRMTFGPGMYPVYHSNVYIRGDDQHTKYSIEVSKYPLRSSTMSLTSETTGEEQRCRGKLTAR